MKILRKNDEFKKMPDHNVTDVLAITAMVRQGWKYCSRKEYKEFHKVIEAPKKEKTEKKSEKKKVK